MERRADRFGLCFIVFVLLEDEGDEEFGNRNVVGCKFPTPNRVAMVTLTSDALA